MRIAVCTLAVGNKYQEAVAIGIETKRRWCVRHGYDFVLDTVHHTPSKPIAWSKIPMIQNLLPSYDYVFCSDADVIIMNDSVRLEDFIEKYMNEKSILLTRDWQDLNTGNVIFKNTYEVSNVLAQMDGLTQFTDHPWWEQRAFIELYRTSDLVRRMTCVLEDEAHKLNAYVLKFPGCPLPERCKYRTSDLLIHLAGIVVLTDIQNILNICSGIKDKEKNDGFRNMVMISYGSKRF